MLLRCCQAHSRELPALLQAMQTLSCTAFSWKHSGRCYKEAVPRTNIAEHILQKIGIKQWISALCSAALCSALLSAALLFCIQAPIAAQTEDWN
eukprot:14451-Heterococcus_DN1.PRE.3